MNRRHFPRFMLRGPWAAQLRSCTDVTIDVIRAAHIHVVSPQPFKPSELLTLELTSGRTCIDVRVLTSTPFFIDDVVFHRVRLECRDRLLADVEAVTTPSPGSLVRVMAVEVLEMSRRGCLLEHHAPLADGSIGRLRVENDAGPFVDDVRICWSVRIEGAGSRYHAGAELLTISRAAESSPYASLRTALPIAKTPVSLP